MVDQSLHMGLWDLQVPSAKESPGAYITSFDRYLNIVALFKCSNFSFAELKITGSALSLSNIALLSIHTQCTVASGKKPSNVQMLEAINYKIDHFSLYLL